MIRVEIVREVDGHGVFEYVVPSLQIEGRSRQPLLDACRQIKSMGGDMRARAGLFREGRSEPDISCLVWAGAKLTVQDSKGGTRFRKWEEFNRAVFQEAAE